MQLMGRSNRSSKHDSIGHASRGPDGLIYRASLTDISVVCEVVCNRSSRPAVSVWRPVTFALEVRKRRVVMSDKFLVEIDQRELELARHVFQPGDLTRDVIR